MTDYIKSSFIKEDRINIKEIPAIILRPNAIKEPLPTVILYHGWASSKEKQRLRGYILASMGYQVVIPDAIYHGDRNPLKYYSSEEATRYFWYVIFKNIDEFDTILEELVINYGADHNRIAVMGNSMGGFTAGGIFTHNENVKVLVVFNGTCAWGEYNKDFKDTGVLSHEEIKLLMKDIKRLDPMNNLNILKDRPILLLHGDNDTSVRIDSELYFYNTLKTMYSELEMIKFVEYPKLNHFVTTNMIEESINWLGKYL